MSLKGTVLKQKSRDQSHPSVPGICEKWLDVLVRTAEATIPQETLHCHACMLPAIIHSFIPKHLPTIGIIPDALLDAGAGENTNTNIY